MASMRDIKRRKESVQSTQQITKAMKLVSTVKLQKARGRAESNKPYFNMLYDTICSILAMTKEPNHKFLKENGSDKKAVEGLARKGYSIYQDESEIINAPLFDDATELTKQLLTQYSKGEIGEVYIAYTNFKNTVTQEAKLMKLLPIREEDFTSEQPISDDKLLMNFEPSEEEVLDQIVPKYMSNIIYGALLEAVASENGARMQAMDSATSNADDMIGSLSLKYNRARQSAITQELTEIIAGADAIS